MHSINLKDHLQGYDNKVSPKQYLSFPDTKWIRWFENEVQYINRIQRMQWLELFEYANLELVTEEQASTDLIGLKVDDKYQCLNQNDLECIYIKILHRKN